MTQTESRKLPRFLTLPTFSGYRSLPTPYPLLDGKNDFAGQGARPFQGVFFEEPLGIGGGVQWEGAADDRLEQALLDPSVDIRGASALLIGWRVEHRKPVERAIPRVERAQGE